MKLNLHPGNLLACRINTHRNHWDGTICSNPEQWNCSAPADFRRDYCAEGVSRCFQLNMFAQDHPHFYIDEGGISWVLEETPQALDDQVILMYGASAETDWGAKPGRNQSPNHVFGLYRVARVEREERGMRVVWKVIPHLDDWICIDHLRIRAPYFDRTAGPYLLQLQRSKLNWLLQDIQERTTASAWKSKAEEKRWKRISTQLPGWMDKAASACSKWVDLTPPSTRSYEAPATPSAPPAPSKGLGFQGLAELSTMVVPTPAVQIVPPPAPAVCTPTSTPCGREPLLTEERSKWVEQQYGEDVSDSIRMASSTKDFMILSGAPGVGKSYLATQFLEDPESERTLLLPISATWRGREDLLGYINPISGEFEATPFTQFLRRAASAWKSGDKRTHLVVFEKFNLSPPEHWLSDVLTITQLAQEKDRYVYLGGAGKEGENRVFLSPGLFFVGTVNNDHTTQPLSPRVLDRVALIPLQLSVRSALKRVGHPLEESTLGAVTDLDRILAPRGVCFSIRTAKALRDSPASGLPPAKALDLILLQGMLVRVRLMAHDPTLESFLELSQGWVERHGSEFPRCASWISSWQENMLGDTDQVWA